MQLAQHGRTPGDEDQAGGIPVQAVYQLQVAILGTQLAQGFDQAKTETTAAVHRQTRRLVDDQQAVVFIDDAVADLPGPVTGHRRNGSGRGVVQRRNPHHVAGRQAIIGLHPPLVHAHLALAQGPIEAGFGHAPEFPHQEVIQPLPHRVLVHAQVAHSGRRLLRLIVGHKLPKSFNFLPFAAIVRRCDCASP